MQSEYIELIATQLRRDPRNIRYVNNYTWNNSWHLKQLLKGVDLRYIDDKKWDDPDWLRGLPEILRSIDKQDREMNTYFITKAFTTNPELIDKLGWNRDFWLNQL